MSWEALEWAGRQRTENVAMQCMLIVLANAADPDGVAFRWWKNREHWWTYLVERTGLVKGSVYRTIGKLEELNLVSRDLVTPEEGGRAQPVIRLRLDQVVVAKPKSPSETDSDASEVVEKSPTETEDSKTGLPEYNVQSPSETPQSPSETVYKSPQSPKNPKEETSPTPPKREGLESEDSKLKESEEALRRFDEFKRAYPDGIVDLAPARAEFMTLSDADQAACVAGVAGYADRCKRRREKSKAGHLYIRRRVWENLAASTSDSTPTLHPPRSPAGRAITILHRIAKAPRPLEIRGMISYRHAITPRLLALADAPPEAEWIDTEVGSNPNGAWRAALDSMLGGTVRPKLLAIRAPWIFPPGVDGKIYTAETATGPPIEPQMTEEDEREFTKGLSE
jgi:hypothetical protein